MAEGSKFPFLPFSNGGGRTAHFEAAYLKLLEVNTALEQRITALEPQVALSYAFRSIRQPKPEYPATPF